MSKVTIHSMKDEQSKTSYKQLGNELRKTLGLAEITRRWNKAGLGRPCKETTVDRWLNPGPATKNINFEGFIVALHQSEAPTASVTDRVTQLHERAMKVGWENKRDAATAASLIAYHQVDRNLSYKQCSLVDDLLQRR